VGNVTIGPGVGIWHNTVIRADVNSVVIGAGTNIQDGCLLHVDLDAPLVVGSGCTVGHGVVLHGCTLQEGCLIGMGATILNHAVVGEKTLLGAGALVAERAVLEPSSLYIGVPARRVRALREDELANLAKSALTYQSLADEHRISQAQAEDVTVRE